MWEGRANRASHWLFKQVKKKPEAVAAFGAVGTLMSHSNFIKWISLFFLTLAVLALLERIGKFNSPK